MISVFFALSPNCDWVEVVTATKRAAKADRRFCSFRPCSEALAIVTGSGPFILPLT